MNAIKIPDTSVRQIQRMSQIYIEGEPKNRCHSSEGDSTSKAVSPNVRAEQQYPLCCHTNMDKCTMLTLYE